MKPHLPMLAVMMAGAVLSARATADFAARGLHWFAVVSAAASAVMVISMVLSVVVLFLRKRRIEG